MFYFVFVYSITEGCAVLLLSESYDRKVSVPRQNSLAAGLGKNYCRARMCKIIIHSSNISHTVSYQEYNIPEHPFEVEEE